jgi:hypothetical protein
MDEQIRQQVGSICFQIGANKLEISGPIDWVRTQCTDFLNKIVIDEKKVTKNEKEVKKH